MPPPSTQDWDPESYARSARFVSDLGAGVVELLDPRAQERILDLGCGDGALTARIATSGAEVRGIDSAPAFVAAARARGLDVRLGDAQRLDADGTYDAVFSNAALHWMPDHAAVLRGVHRALVPGGRFVGELGGHGNVAAIRVALAAVLATYGIDATANSPWTFPTAVDFRSALEGAGFTVDTVTLTGRPTPLPGTIDDWLAVFAAPFFATLAPADRDVARSAVIALLRPVLGAGDGWIADDVRLRFRAYRQHRSRNCVTSAGCSSSAGVAGPTIPIRCPPCSAQATTACSSAAVGPKHPTACPPCSAPGSGTGWWAAACPTIRSRASCRWRRCRERGSPTEPATTTPCRNPTARPPVRQPSQARHRARRA